jgi:hypothetical protein
VVNVAANYAVNQCTNVFGRIDNLFTEQYQNPSGFDRPGIGIFGGIRISNPWRRMALANEERVVGNSAPSSSHRRRCGPALQLGSRVG